MTGERIGTGAFERFFLAEHPKLVALGLGWTGDRELARELAQEALVRAYRSWSTVELLDLPGAWVRRVMLNLLIDHRRNQDRQRDAIERMDRRPVAAAPDASGDASGDAWWRAVRALPDRERAAVTLHYLEDLSIAAVAEILEVKPGTVKASLSHAREKLRATLGGET